MFANGEEHVSFNKPVLMYEQLPPDVSAQEYWQVLSSGVEVGMPLC